MKTQQKLLGISLALVMLVGSVSIPLGFSEPLRVQLEQGIESDQIQCSNDSHVLVERTNGNLACVSERTAEKMGWEIIPQYFNNEIDKIITTKLVPHVDEEEDILIELQLLTLSDENNNLLIVDNTTPESSNVGYRLPDPLSFYPASLALPSTVELDQPFEVEYTWQFFEVDKDGDIDRASEFPDFRDTETVTLKVYLPAKVEFVNYQELGYLVIREDVSVSTDLSHTVTYTKDIQYNESEIQKETLILKITSMPSEIINEGFGIGLILMGTPDLVYLAGVGENSILLTTEFSIPLENLRDERGEFNRAECDDKCLNFVQNVRHHIKYQDMIIQKFVENNNDLSAELRSIRDNFQNHLYHNENATFKEFAQDTNYLSSETNYSNNADAISNEIDSIILAIEEENEEKQQQIDNNEPQVPLDIDSVNEMFMDMFGEEIENGEINQDAMMGIIASYNFPQWFVDELLDTYPDLVPQSAELNSHFFFLV